MQEWYASFCAFWKGVLGTYDLVSHVFDLNHTIRQIPFADVVKSRLEEFSLKKRRDVGNNNDNTGMQWLPPEECKKIGAVVGYKRKLLLTIGNSCQSFRPPRLR